MILRRVAVALLGLMSLVACTELIQLSALFAFEEHDDPDVQALGDALFDVVREIRYHEAMVQYNETGDPKFLEEAKSARPDDTTVQAHIFVQKSSARGNPDESAAAMESLVLFETRRLNAARDFGDPPVHPTDIRRNVLTSIYNAQISLLGGSLTEPWERPGDLAAPQTQELYEDYCVTRRQLADLMTEEWRNVHQPPCPGD